MIMNHHIKIKVNKPDLSNGYENDEPIGKQKKKSDLDSFNKYVNSCYYQVPPYN